MSIERVANYAASTVFSTALLVLLSLQSSRWGASGAMLALGCAWASSYLESARLTAEVSGSEYGNVFFLVIGLLGLAVLLGVVSLAFALINGL